MYRILEENSLLTVYLPPENKAFVFRVKSIANKNRFEINYGPIPLPAGTSLPTFEAGSVSVPAYGVLPGRSYTPTGISFPLAGAYDSGDMWYIPEDYRDRLFHVIQRVTPSFLRIDLQIPKGVTQGRFQKDKVVIGVDADFGFARGVYETIHLPKIRYGYRYANDSNPSVYTFVKFIYGEYVVEIPRNPELIFDVLTKRTPSYWITLPVNVMDPAIQSALIDTYGITGFTVHSFDNRSVAIREYSDLLGRVRV